MAGDLIIGTCGFTNEPKHAVAMMLKDGQLSEAWRIERNVPHIPCPIVIRDRVYLWEDKGIGTCVDHQTGKLVWQKRVGGNYFSSPICVDGKLYNVDRDGEVVVVTASAEYQLLGRNQLGETILSTMAVGNGMLFVRTESHLISLGGK
jgi:outer membrane protein assembly factor BamB